MKTVLALFLSCLITYTLADTSEDCYCCKQSGANFDEMNKTILTKTLQDKPEHKKFLLCIAEKDGFMKNGQLFSQPIINEFQKITNNQADAIQLYQDCVIYDGEPQDIVFAFVTCLNTKILNHQLTDLFFAHQSHH